MKRIRISVLALLLYSLPVLSQNSPSSSDPLKALLFLEGTWKAATTQTGSAGAVVTGTYRFKRELGDHILARSSTPSDCVGPADFNCKHGDLLYVYVDAPGQTLKAICFDNEGHVIHYDVSTPAPTTAIFLSDSSRPGPQFRLVYDLKDGTMAGKFQMRAPGQTEWKSYLEWNGRRLTQ